MSRIKLEDRLVELANMKAAQLTVEWSKLSDGIAPNVPASLLRRLVAQRLQEKRHRGLPILVARELDTIAAGGSPDVGKSGPNSPVVIRSGTTLMREWNGQTISVTALDDGFEYEGKHYGSLSHIAKQVTGAYWSGPRFFGLAKRSSVHG